MKKVSEKLTERYPVAHDVPFYVVAAMIFLLMSIMGLLGYLFLRTATLNASVKSLRQELDTFRTMATNDVCPASCEKKITESKDALEVLIQASAFSGGGSTSVGSKESVIALGSGVNQTDDWVDVSGASASIDTANYRAVKKVVFEASIAIPTGNQKAYVRLFNATDKHPVWNSELSMEGGTPKLLVSPPITLDAGNKVYQVQMKTSLKYPANLTQSRVRISMQ